MLGYTPKELQGKPARTIYASAEDYARTGARVQAEFAVHGAFDGDVCFMRKDGSPVWARVQGRVRADAMDGGTVDSGRHYRRPPGAAAADLGGIARRADPALQPRRALDQRLGALLAERSTRVCDDSAPAQAGALAEGVVLFMDPGPFHRGE